MESELDIYDDIFTYFTYSWYLFFFVSKMGIWDKSTIYLNEITFFYRLFISIVLLILFNPYRKINFTEIHRKIVFTSAFFLITSDTLVQLYHKIQSNLNTIRAFNS